MSDTMKKGRLTLIKLFFMPEMGLREATAEINKLSDLDKTQLASAIAQQQGLTQDECNFNFVKY